MLSFGKNLMCVSLHVTSLWNYMGDDFQVMFAEIGDIRSLLPKCVKILALTATLTRETLKCVTSRLSLEDPVIIGLPPDRSNYTVKPIVPILELCNQLNYELLLQRSGTPKTVLFVSLWEIVPLFCNYEKVAWEKFN